MGENFQEKSILQMLAKQVNYCEVFNKKQILGSDTWPS